MIRDQANGFTLIELVVTLTLLGIIAGFVGAPLITMIEARQDINEKVAQNADAVFALEKISNEIRFGLLDPKNLCDSNGVTAENATGRIRYKYDGAEKTLTADRLSNSDAVMLTDVVDFSCERFSNPSSLYELTLELESANYKSRAYHRN